LQFEAAEFLLLNILSETLLFASAMPRTTRTFSSEFSDEPEVLVKARRVSFDYSPSHAYEEQEIIVRTRRVSFDTTPTSMHAMTPRQALALAADAMAAESYLDLTSAFKNGADSCQSPSRRVRGLSFGLPPFSLGLPSVDEDQAGPTTALPATPSSSSSKERMEVPHLSLEAVGYTITKEIAQVSQGSIELAEHRPTGGFRCVKCFHKSKMQTDTQEFIKAEVELMFELGEHPNIGEAVMVFQDPQSFYLVQPYYRGGNLQALKHRAIGAGVGCTEGWWRSIFVQCLTGLAHMHAQDVMHCDIKEANIMLKDDDLGEPEIVIIDLGVAQRAGTERDIIYGTPGYIPPEVWEAKNWHPQSDMFSLGVVVMQLLIGKMGLLIENTSNFKEMKEATLLREPPFELMPLEFPAFTGLVKKLLAKDYLARPTAEAMLQESWDEAPVPDSDSDAAEEELQLRKVAAQRRHTWHTNAMKVRPIGLKRVVVHDRRPRMQTLHLGVQNGIPVPLITHQLRAFPVGVRMPVSRRRVAFAS